MGRHAKSEALQAGPMLWARFLKWHFGCDDLAPLNAQLLLPITPHEGFQFGKSPCPLTKRYAPKVFEQAYRRGRNPDGSYTSEGEKGVPKFNLYERVLARVPESKYWLLKELNHYFTDRAPSIDVSARVVRKLTKELGVLLIEREFIEAWASIDAAGVAAAEANTFDALVENVLPEYLALVFASLHISVWQESPRIPADLPSKLFVLSIRVLATFITTVESLGLQDGEAQAEGLADLLKCAICTIVNSGTHSESANSPPPPDLAKHFALVPDTVAARKAAVYLVEATEPHDYVPMWLESQLNATVPQRTQRDDHDLRQAAAQLCAAASEVPILLAERAARRLHRYDEPGRMQKPQLVSA